MVKKRHLKGIVIKTTYPDGTHEDVSYASCCGAMGDKPGAVTDRTGRTVEYDYDAAGRVTRATDSAGNSVNYSYDTGGQLLQLKDTRSDLSLKEWTGKAKGWHDETNSAHHFQRRLLSA